jgi:NhaP-type Na+/H+ or K+/H+ antiporter
MLKAILIGLVVGLAAAFVIQFVPAVRDTIPANMHTLIIGGLAGGAAALAMGSKKTPDDDPQS